MIPSHKIYIEPFVGGGAVFWAKEKSEAECLNDTNKHLMDFYECLKNDFVSLEKMVRISLHSRSLNSDAKVIYNNGHMFSKLERAWSVWVMAANGFAGMLDSSYGYDKSGKTSKVISNKRLNLTEDYAIRMQEVDIECTDALRIIRSRDCEDAFFYLDPPYFNSDCGHYDGYSQQDFKELLTTLENIKGKFILSSYQILYLFSFSLPSKVNSKPPHPSVLASTP